jgi:hypothetical protein
MGRHLYRRRALTGEGQAFTLVELLVVIGESGTIGGRASWRRYGHP